MFKCVSSYRALCQGANLWILPLEPENFRFKQINWRLRFLICSPLEDRPPARPLLLSVEGGLPVRRILCLPKEKISENWPVSCHRHWKRLEKPSLRVFLPSSLDGRAFINHWPEKEPLNIPGLVQNSPRQPRPRPAGELEQDRFPAPGETGKAPSIF